MFLYNPRTPNDDNNVDIDYIILTLMPILQCNYAELLF